MESMIAPSLMCADFLHLGEELKKLESAGIEYLHIDIMDGVFVPNLSFGPPIIQRLRPVTPLFFDVHLMMEYPDRLLDAFADAGADSLNLHVECRSPLEPSLRHIRQRGLKSGLTLKPGSPAEAVFPYLPLVDMVLIMTVEPGFGGQAFMESQLDTIRQVRALIERYNPACELEVDGGISPKTAPLVVEAGANVLVAGSAVYGAEDIPAAIQALRVSGGVRGERV